MTSRVFLIHGWGSKPEGGWRPWLKAELEKRGFDVYVPAMPSPSDPKMDEWVLHMQNVVGDPDENCYLVGHSLGATAILRYLESLETGEEIGGAVLAAGPVERDKDDDLRSFFSREMDWEKIKLHCKKFVAIYSDNDYVVPMKNGEMVRDMLGAKLVVEHGLGHISGGGDNVRKLPSALSAVLEISKN